jgi:exopolyphosphatase/guanosine-5'-triphosphate,3'-diphosphate pyrophosphatase
MDLYQENLKSHAPYHLSDLISKAVLFGGDEARARKSIELAEKIFDMTKSLHRLHQSWRPLLTAAMGLRNIGISVSPTNYGAHSAYMVKNLDIFTAEPWETDLVSELCRHHADIKAEFNGHAPFKNDKQLRNIFMRLLSLLRIADALDSESSTDLKIRKIRILKHKVEFHIKTNVLGELKSLRVEQKQPLFVKTFKRQPILITKR